MAAATPLIRPGSPRWGAMSASFRTGSGRSRGAPGSVTTSRSSDIALGAAGTTTCVRVVNAHGEGAPGATCVTRLSDERALRASRYVWRARSDATAYSRTLLTAARRGAIAQSRILRADVLAVYAPQCGTCGRVEVLWRGARVGTFSQRARPPFGQPSFKLTLPTTQRGVLTLRTLDARPVYLDAFAAHRFR